MMIRPPAPARRRGAPFAALALVFGFNAAFAADFAATPRFDIPAQSLAGALNTLATQAGVQLVFTPETVGQGKAKALQGEMRVDAALGQLLAGSGLEFKREGEKRYVVVRAAAQTPAKETNQLAPVTVTATRTERRVDDVPASVSVISAQDIARQQPRVVADLLKNVEGIDVVTGGSLTSTSMLRMRGVPLSFTGPTSQVLLDGLPLESGTSAIHLGFQSIAPFDLERVEVLRGPASSLYGPSAMGGVVNLMPKRWRGAPGAEIELGAGSHNATQVSAAVGAVGEMGDFRLSATDYRTDGYIAQPQLVGKSKDLAPRDGARQNLSFSGGLHLTDNQEISLALRQADTRAPWLGGHPNYRMHTKVDGIDLGYRFEAGNWGTFKLRYRWLKQWAHSTFDNEYANGKSGSLILAEEDWRNDRSQTFEFQSDLRLIPNNVLTLGANYGEGQYRIDSHDVLAKSANDVISKSKTLGLFFQDEHYFNPRFSVLVGGRWDRFEMYGDTSNGVSRNASSTDSVFNPRLGLRYQFNNALSLYGTAGTAYAPALNQFKWGTSRQIANPGLKPEYSTSYEIGLKYESSRLTARAALFHTDYRDMIGLIIDAANKRQFQNVGKVTVDGLELGVEGKLPGGWTPYANYTYVDSLIRKNPDDPLTEGRRNSWIAPQKFNIGVTYSPSDAWYARFAGRYVSSLYFDDRNTRAARNPSYFVIDTKFGWQLPGFGFVKKPELTFAVNNLFDKRYVEWRNTQADRRNFWVGLSAQFN